MKILLISQQAPLQNGQVASGNSLRQKQLSSAMAGDGHLLDQVWLAGPNQARPDRSTCFRNRDELHGLILAKAPDVILLSYWELATLLPFDLNQPVVLDYVAPRPLESLYQDARTVRADLRRLRAALQACDLVLVGNRQQRDLLINTLIESGFDLSQHVPVVIVPLGGETVGPPQSSPEDAGWTLVSGGVSWPWRNSQHYLLELSSAAQRCDKKVSIVQFGGNYPEQGIEKDLPPQLPKLPVAGIECRDLLPYEDYSAFLSHTAHIGLELAEWNIERAYSQSFRSLDFLRHGLPLLCNRYLPLASLVESYDAGWLVDEPSQLPALLKSITDSREQWQSKSAGALRLVEEELRPAISVRPLLDWLKAPQRAKRLPPELRLDELPPVLGVPPLRQRLKRQFQLAQWVGLGRLFGQKPAGKGVLFVTRGDLFPPDHGAAVRTVETARALANSGLPVGIVTENPRHWYEFEDGEFKTRRFPFWLSLLRIPGPLLKLLHHSKDLPHSNSFLYMPLSDGGFFWRILVAARSVRPGVLQAEFPAYAQPCLKTRDILGCKVVLVEHNVEYERLRTQLDELTEAQYLNLKQIELSLCQQSDAVVCVSDNDRQQLINDGIRADRLHTIGHGVRLSDYRGPAATKVRETYEIADDEPLLVYHGTFSYPPNRQAIQIFADILLPGLERDGLKCHVLAVGKAPPSESPHPRIHFTGSVTEVAPWLKAADLSVVPLIEGGGTRMKIVDCFAAGLAVISTSKGIEGIPVEPGKHALVIDDWDEMIQAIVRLCKQSEQRQQIAQAGADLASGMDWSAVAQRFRAVYSALG